MKETDRPAGHRQPGRIIVIRHGKPALDRDAGPRLDWRAYCDWWAKYEAGSLAPGQTCPKDLARTIGEDAVFLTSVRPRAIETAALIARGRPMEHDAIFNEAPLPPPQWSDRRRYLPKTWNKFARLAWLLGHAGGEEPVEATRRRAIVAADRLIAATGGGADVVLVAHGWFNRMLRRPLARRGWRCVRDGGDSYWSHRIYVRKQ